MSDELWKVALGIAGLGAIGAAVFFFLYKQWLTLPIFQRMTKDQQYKLFKLFLILTFVFAIFTLVIYAYTKRVEAAGEKKAVTSINAMATENTILASPHIDSPHIDSPQISGNSNTVNINQAPIQQEMNMSVFNNLMDRLAASNKATCTAEMERDKYCAKCKEQEKIIEGFRNVARNNNAMAELKQSKDPNVLLQILVNNHKNNKDQNSANIISENIGIISVGYIAGQFDTVETAANEILSLSPNHLYALQMKAYAQYLNADWEKCICTYKLVVANPDITQEAVSDTYSMLSLVYYWNGQMKESELCDEKQVAYFEMRYAIDGNVRGKLASALCGQAEAMMSLGELNKCEPFLVRARSLASQTDDLSLKCLITGDIVRMYEHRGEDEGEDFELLKKTHVAMLSQMKDSPHKFIYTHSYSGYLIDNNQYDTAKEYAKSLVEFNKDSREENKIDSFIVNADLNLALKNYGEAEMWALKIKSIVERRKMKVHTLNCYSLLALIYLDWEKYDLAFANYQKALLLSKECETKFTQATLSYNLGVAYFRAKDYRSAYFIGVEAKKLYQAMNLPIQAMKAAGKLDDLYPRVFEAN